MIPLTPPAPIVLTGYKLAKNLLERYDQPLPPIRRLIQALQRVLNIPIMFVEVEDEDDDEDPTLYVCCWVDSLMFPGEKGSTQAGICGMEAPPVFERVKEVLGTEGELRRRMFSPMGRVYAVQEASWD